MSDMTQQSVADCEQTLQQLEAKRAKLVARNAELPALRKTAAFAAHVEASPGARRTLNQINAESASYEPELASLDDAIAAAKNKVLIAQAFEADAADRVRAREALEILVAFKKCGHELDAALRIVGERGRELDGILAKLHAATGVRFPTHEQVDSLGFQALTSSLMSTKWSNRFRVLAPNQRRTFGSLFDGWATGIGNRLRARLSEENEAA
jgi:hypothetical protein